MKTAKLLLLISLLFWFEPTEAQSIKVMTYNIRLSTPSDSLNYWGYRKAEMVQFFEKEQVGILGLQEVLWEQLIYLKENLKGYQSVGVGRDDGKEAGEFSPIFVDTQQFSILSSHTFWLSPTPLVPSKGWDAALNRICTWVLVEHKLSLKKYKIYNSHFDHVGKIARDSSASLILKQVNLERDSISLLVMGDFNSEPNDAAILNFRSTLNDASFSYDDPMGLGTFNGFGKHQNTFKQIDFIFYQGFNLVKFRVLRPQRANGLQLSDHYAVAAILE